MSVPTVVALRLEEAEALLRSEGLSIIDVKQTRPPRWTPEGPLRVIRQQTLPDGVELTVAASVPLLGMEKDYGSS
jgi:hypothetical protein